jgi:hypothetical protein
MKEFGVESYGYDPLLSKVEKKEKDVIIRVYNAINHRKTWCRIRIEWVIRGSAQGSESGPYKPLEKV